jgi:hypothetical protein
VGDSFTPSGIDDYCLQNRNFLHEGQGFFRCLDQLEKLPAGCLLLNQHVDPAFRFSRAQISLMRETLQKRIPLLQDLLPFDDPNYGLDEGWAALHPYWPTVRAGDSASLKLRIRNHSPRAQEFRPRLRMAEGLKVTGVEALRVKANSDGAISFTAHVSSDSAPGLRVITADLAWGNTELREWAEMVLEVVR